MADYASTVLLYRIPSSALSSDAARVGNKPPKSIIAAIEAIILRALKAAFEPIFCAKISRVFYPTSAAP
jgi:hypothetical protein